MSERAKSVSAGILVALLSIAIGVLIFTNETPDDRVERLGSSIKCPVCQGEAIADSPSPMARDMMGLVEQRVEAGATDQEIVDELLASFSGAVLLDPPASGATLALWLAPAIALIVGVAVVMWWRAHPGASELAPGEPATGRSRRLVGGLILIGGFAAVVVVAGALLQEPASPTEGAAAIGDTDIETASNQTLEAVIAANLDHPRINGMRLALAERYFEAGDYRSAFPHYLAVAEGAGSTDAEATTALIRLGWMAYDGNGEIETAATLFDEALAISPGSEAALYLKGQVLWCGAGDNAGAAELFRTVLASDSLDEQTRDQVEADLALVDAGEACA